MIFFGFGLGAMTLVGKSIGADLDKQARRTGMVTGAVGIIAAIFIALFLYIASDQLFFIFTNDQAVINLGNILILVFAIIQLPKGANVVYSGNLRGSADLNWLMWLAIVTVLIYEILLSWFFAISLGFGLIGIWFIQGVDELTRFCLNFWRFNKGKWKRIEL
jgi:Na+-driven multidrug efflux pump